MIVCKRVENTKPRTSRTARFIALLFGAFALMCVALQSDTQAVVLAKVGNEPITDTNLLILASNRSVLKGIRYRDPALVRELVEDMIVDELVTQEARRLDLSDDYSFRTRLMMDVTDAALRLQAFEVGLPSLTIDSAAVDSYYHANIERYTVPRPQRWVRQITVYKAGQGLPEQYGKFVDSLYDGWNPKRKIDSIYTRLINGEDFTKLALAHSEELTARETGGNLGWVSEMTVHEGIIRDWIFSLPPHMISKPLESDFGWHIAQVCDTREPGPAPIDPQIEADIHANLMVDLGKTMGSSVRDSLFGVATIDYNEDALAGTDSGIEPGTNLAVVNGRDTLWGAAYFIMKNQRAATREANLSAQGKKDLIRPLLQHICLSQWVGEQGYFERPELQAFEDRLRLQEARSVIYSRFDAADVEPDSAELRAYYRSHLRDYIPDRRHLVQRYRAATKREADSVVSAWRAGQVDVAEQQWVGPEDLPNTMWNRVAAVPPGTVIGPIKDQDDYLIMRLDQIATARPFDDVRLLITKTLRDSKRAKLRETFVREATRKFGVQRFTERMNAIEFPTRPEFLDMQSADSLAFHSPLDQ